MTLAAGTMTNRVRFERAGAAEDGFGNVTNGTWTGFLTVWAAFRPKFGREQVEAGRLESGLTGTIMIHRSAAALGITPSDRAVFVAGPYAGRTVNIRSIVPSPDASAVEMTVEEGVAT